MAQERLTIDGHDIKQPITFDPNWETTYTEDTQRVMSGRMQMQPLFTVESYSLEFANLSIEQCAEILQIIVPRPDKPSLTFHYFSWYYGCWRDDEFYVGKGSIKTKTLKRNYERVDRLTFNIIGVNPVV